MIYFEETQLSSLILHKVGNKTNEEGVRLSKSPVGTDDTIRAILLTYFFSPFKQSEYYCLYHESELALNDMYSYVSKIFDNPDSLFEQSTYIAKHLYEQSVHPKIKSGELYIAYFKDCIVDGESVDAVGIFKSESHETYLKIYSNDDGFEIGSEAGINIQKLDKGCLIFNTEREDGYVVATVDNLSKTSEAAYWRDDFLKIKARADNFYHTQNVIGLCKNFVTERLPETFDVNKADQADMLNKSVKFLKENEVFDIEEFAQEVMQVPELIESFKEYKQDYEEQQNIQIADEFDISEAAVKKQARVLKSVIKLDKNFHVYVHGNREYIKKGFDASTGLHYYQLFFNDES